MKIGILAIQGDFQAHAAMFRKLGVDTVEVRTVSDLGGCNGLVLPGGESTTQIPISPGRGSLRRYTEICCKQRRHLRYLRRRNSPGQ